MFTQYHLRPLCTQSMTFIANVLVHEIRHIVRARALFNLNHFWLALQIDHKGWENAQSNVISPCVISLKSKFIKCVKFRRIYTVGIKFLLLLHQICIFQEDLPIPKFTSSTPIFGRKRERMGKREKGEN